MHHVETTAAASLRNHRAVPGQFAVPTRSQVTKTQRQISAPRVYIALTPRGVRQQSPGLLRHKSRQGPANPPA